MKKNIGTIDRIIRIAITSTIGLLLFKGIITGWLGLLLGIIAIILLLTGLIRTCPAYLPFSLSTRKK